MPILSIAYLKDGIIMSSDCRGTFSKEINGVMEYRTADRAPKTFLINSINVGKGCRKIIKLRVVCPP